MSIITVQIQVKDSICNNRTLLSEEFNNGVKWHQKLMNLEKMIIIQSLFVYDKL